MYISENGTGSRFASEYTAKSEFRVSVISPENK
jgi:hypothetical protein